MLKLKWSWFMWLAALACPIGAQEEAKEPAPVMTLAEAGGGTLLYKDLEGALRPAPCVANDVQLDITALIVRATVQQVFRNPGDEVVDAVYVFPLPDTAAVDGIKMIIGERTIEGEIRERAEARKKFQAARKQGKKASLVEQERPNLFTASVANLGPGEQVEVRLTYQHEVAYDSGTLSLHFPSTLTPRYIPGTERVTGFSGTGWGINTDQVPDAERVTPRVAFGADTPTLSLALTLEAGFALRRIESPSHSLDIDAPEDGRLEARLAKGSVPADRDFRLEWEPVRGAAPTAAMFVEEMQGDRYALLMMLPPDPAQTPGERLPRETTFIIDTSGSMSGTSIQQARQSVLSGLGTLRVGDSFNVIEFDSWTRTLFESPVAASPDNLARAERWVRNLSASGGTEMLSALRAAFEQVASDERVQQVIFITDGSVGNERALFSYIQANLGARRLYTVGIGSAPNRYFMRGAARFGRGTFTHVAALDEVSARMGELLGKLNAPVLTDLALEWKGAGDVDAWPSRVPDLYRGEPLVVVAKLPPTATSLTITGRRRAKPFSAELALEGGATQRGIHKLWARRKIAGLMEGLATGRPEAEIRPEVTTVALGHHLVSRYTSLVAVDKTPTVDAPGATRAVASALPAGNTMFRTMPQTATPAPLLLLLGSLSLSGAGLLRRRGR